MSNYRDAFEEAKTSFAKGFLTDVMDTACVDEVSGLDIYLVYGDHCFTFGDLYGNLTVEDMFHALTRGEFEAVEQFVAQFNRKTIRRSDLS